MDIRPIHTDTDHKAALRELSAYFDHKPEPGTPNGDRFEVLLTLVEAYAGLTPKDLVPAIGRLNRVYEILARKRPLTLNMIWRVHSTLGIPAESLIRPSNLSGASYLISHIQAANFLKFPPTARTPLACTSRLGPLATTSPRSMTPIIP